MLGFFKGGKRGRQAYAFISSSSDVAVEEQESMIKMWSSMSRHSIVKWFIDDGESLLAEVTSKPLPIVVFEESLLDRNVREVARKRGVPIISAKPKEGPPTVGC